MRRGLLVLSVAVVVFTPGDALAYFGPGLGAGLLSVIIGIVASIFLAIFGIVWYPLKRILKAKKQNEHKGVSG